jgi:hypothetical protein
MSISRILHGSVEQVPISKTNNYILAYGRSGFNKAITLVSLYNRKLYY